MGPTDFTVFANRETGRVNIRSAVPLVSLQAARQRITNLQAALRHAISANTDFLMTHDIEVTLTWFISEKDRYQTHMVSDLDNVIKPLLDAATGPEGIMIDDNQVQSIRASWMTPGPQGTGFELDFQSLMRDDTVTRARTSFVEFSADQCYILPGIHPELWPRLVPSYRRKLETRAEIMRLSNDEYLATQCYPRHVRSRNSGLRCTSSRYSTTRTTLVQIAAPRGPSIASPQYHGRKRILISWGRRERLCGDDSDILRVLARYPRGGTSLRPEHRFRCLCPSGAVVHLTAVSRARNGSRISQFAGKWR